MKKFSFSLQKVLEHRQLVKTLAQGDLQVELHQLFILEQELSQLQNRLSESFPEIYAQQSQGGSLAASLSSMYEFQTGQALRIEKQKEKIEIQKNKVEERRLILQQRSQEFKIIEKLKERKRAEHSAEVSAEEAKDIEDLTVMRFLKR